MKNNHSEDSVFSAPSAIFSPPEGGGTGLGGGNGGGRSFLSRFIRKVSRLASFYWPLNDFMPRPCFKLAKKVLAETRTEKSTEKNVYKNTIRCRVAMGWVEKEGQSLCRRVLAPSYPCSDSYCLMYKRNVKDFSNCTNCVYLKVGGYASVSCVMSQEYFCGGERFICIFFFI